MSRPPSKSSKSGAESFIIDSHRMTQGMLGVICFVAGAAVMVVEISANRLLAPNFGNSLYTWTALIGVILVSFSVGGFLGGWWADKSGRLSSLGWLLALAAATTMVIPFTNSLLSPSLRAAGWISGPVIASLFLFALPGIFLGAVSPASVRFYSLAGHNEHVGRAAGTISMLGSLGSFVGTFLSGFVLLASFGVKTIFLGTGVTLLVLAGLAFWMAKARAQLLGQAVVPALAAFLCTWFTESAMGKDVLYQRDSFYHRIEVLEMSGDRYLKLDSTTEGGMRVKDGDLILDYQHYWQLAELNENLKLRRALFIGAGAFGMPEQVAKRGKDVSVDVVEIDPAVIETGKRFFKLDEFTNVHAHASDARRFLNASKGGYDLIFGDAYNGIRHIPAHLVTKEFFEEVRGKLSPDGVFLMNVISSVEGDRAELLGAILATLTKAFPHVELFTAGGGRTEVQNLILMASVNSWKPWVEERFYSAGSWQGRLIKSRIATERWPAMKEVFTDDWNPVDVVIARQLRS